MIRARILVVEDDCVVGRDIQQQLTRMGHTVVGVAGRAEDAVALAIETQPSLALMDIRLEGAVDGFEAARQIRERCQIPIIYLTAHADDDTLRRASSTEPFAYLLKPFEDSQLRTAIEIALHKHGAERRLRESERRYAITLSSIGDGVIATDEHMRVTFMNPVASALAGWPSGEAVGRPLAEVFRIFNEDTRETVEDPASKVLRLGTVVGVANHTALLARDGRVVPIDDCGSPIIDDQGGITGAVLVFRDVTQRRQAEEAEALRTLNARIDEAVRGSNIGVWVNDMPDGDYRTGRITVWNMWEHLGYQPRGPADDASWVALMHPDDREPIAVAMQRYVSGEPSDFEIPLRLRHADGSYRSFLVRGIVVRDGLGTPIRFAGTSVDITDRKRAEEALRTSEHRFRTFVEHATDAFILYDERGVILDVNSQLCASLGYTPEELIGKTPLYFNSGITAAVLDGGVSSDLEDRAARGELEEAGPLVAELARMGEELLQVVDGISLATLQRAGGEAAR